MRHYSFKTKTYIYMQPAVVLRPYFCPPKFGTWNPLALGGPRNSGSRLDKKTGLVAEALANLNASQITSIDNEEQNNSYRKHGATAKKQFDNDPNLSDSFTELFGGAVVVNHSLDKHVAVTTMTSAPVPTAIATNPHRASTANSSSSASDLIGQAKRSLADIFMPQEPQQQMHRQRQNPPLVESSKRQRDAATSSSMFGGSFFDEGRIPSPPQKKVYNNTYTVIV